MFILRKVYAVNKCLKENTKRSDKKKELVWEETKSLCMGGDMSLNFCVWSPSL